MRIQSSTRQQLRSAEMAFALIEVLMGSVITAIAVVSLYAGMSASFAVTKLSRENLRATQIMLERMEGIRLLNYDQLTNTTYNPTSFVQSYYPSPLAGESTGITYKAFVSVTAPTSLVPTNSYKDQMKEIKITIFWTNYYGDKMTNKIVRTRSMTTYSARNGIQNYVYSN